MKLPITLVMLFIASHSFAQSLSGFLGINYAQISDDPYFEPRFRPGFEVGMMYQFPTENRWKFSAGIGFTRTNTDFDFQFFASGGGIALETHRFTDRVNFGHLIGAADFHLIRNKKLSPFLHLGVQGGYVFSYTSFDHFPGVDDPNHNGILLGSDYDKVNILAELGGGIKINEFFQVTSLFTSAIHDKTGENGWSTLGKAFTLRLQYFFL